VYCAAECQRVHWKGGGHKSFCKGLLAARTFISAAEHAAAAAAEAGGAEQGCSCIICLESKPQPIQSRCACRGDAGLAHVACRIKAAEHSVRRTGKHDAWVKCTTCNQLFTGATTLGLTSERWRHVQRAPETVPERVDAALELGDTLGSVRKFAEAESILRYALALATRAWASDSAMVSDALNSLAAVLGVQGKHAEAEALLKQRQVQRTRLHGSDSAAQMSTASSRATSLVHQGKYSEALAILRKCLAFHKRVDGTEHRNTLNCASSVGDLLGRMGEVEEGDALYLEYFPIITRVFGPDHTQTLRAVKGHAMCIGMSGRYDEAEAMLVEIIAVHKRVSGPASADTVDAMRALAAMREYRVDITAHKCGPECGGACVGK
jgi:tetratricopeptide (TPR) repeat protein